MATKTAPSSSSRLCLCAPTTHPGSFRCSLHRRPRNVSDKSTPRVNQSKASNIDNWNKSDLVKAFLMQIIKPSSHDLQRRRNFQPKPSRFCNVGSDGLAVS